LKLIFVQFMLFPFGPSRLYGCKLRPTISRISAIHDRLSSERARHIQRDAPPMGVGFADAGLRPPSRRLRVEGALGPIGREMGGVDFGTVGMMRTNYSMAGIGGGGH